MQLKNTKKTVYVALALLLVCTVVLVSASYAWLTISNRPEISGISTNLGANGSLEIALLNPETYLDPSLIRTDVGNSLVTESPVYSNQFWGNVLDLNDVSYGLNNISLFPSRLDAADTGDGKVVVGSNLLMVPTYGSDGRFSTFVTDIVTGGFDGMNFTYQADNQHYGVRGVGTVSSITSQQTALTNARSLVKSYNSAAMSATLSAWRANGPGLLDISRRMYGEGSDSFTDGDVALLRDTAVRLQGALGYVESALRQGMVGIAASVIADEAEFAELRRSIENPVIPLSMLVSNGVVSPPSGTIDCVEKLDEDKLQMQNLVRLCDRLSGGVYTRNQIEPLLELLLNVKRCYLNETRMNDSDAYGLMTEDNQLTLAYSRDGGQLAEMAEYCGDYRVFFTLDNNASVEAIGHCRYTRPYIEAITYELNKVEAAGGGELSSARLEDLYGFAVDLAFRCNQESNLLLQTLPALRVDENTEISDVQGGGSYMRFASYAMNTDQMLHLMDAIRVGFMDNQNNLLALGKLNISNYALDEEGNILAPLYLYEYTLAMDRSISIGERRSGEQVIMPLPEDTATTLTVLVWLDGDHVENSMVATFYQSMTGMLNLQFTSSADLKPAFPVKPENPSEPENPETPEEPENPEEPEEPEIPETPEEVTLVASGHATDTIDWSVYSNGLLSFDGTGPMPEYSGLDLSEIPWYPYAQDITDVQLSDGITSLGRANLLWIPYETITIPESLVSIAAGNDAVGYLHTVNFGGSARQWSAVAIQDSVTNRRFRTATLNAEDPDARAYRSGTVEGTNVSWTLYEDGILVIRGEDNVDFYWTATNGAPWSEHKDRITAVIVEEGVQDVGEYAFYGFPALRSAILPASLTRIGAAAFKNCSKLVAVDIADASRMGAVGQGAFAMASSLRHVDLSDGVHTIETSAFTSCRQLEYINLPESVDKLGSSAFFDCDQLKRIVLPEGIMRIGSYTFSRCVRLKEVHLPSTLFTVGDGAFQYAPSQPLEVHFAGSELQWQQVEKGSFNDGLAGANLHYGATIISQGEESYVSWAVDDKGSLIIYGEGYIPDFRQSYRQYPPWEYETYSRVLIYRNVYEIGEFAFYGASELTELWIHPDMWEINWSSAFSSTGLTDVYICGSWDDVSYQDWYDQAYRRYNVHFR